MFRVCLPVVHGEDVLCHSPKLHDNVLNIRVMDNLEVLDRGLGHAAVKVEDITLGLVIPHRSLVMNLNKKISFTDKLVPCRIALWAKWSYFIILGGLAALNLIFSVISG